METYDEPQQVPGVEKPAAKPVEEVKERIIVVKELPTQELRNTVGEDGSKILFLTTEEALTELLNK